MLPCGCEHVCCGICEHAARAGRPRLFTRESAAQWDPPNLTDYRGADKLEARNGDSGEPTMWFWQMTGTRWPAHDKRESRTTFNTATKAWRRLTASQEERSAETAARYDREDARLELEAAEELRAAIGRGGLEQASAPLPATGICSWRCCAAPCERRSLA